ncbi:MAG: polyphosphate kinase 2 family protein [Thermoanaerobaculaceae bacterium]|nr:polyphosphate kinase 2 family protein [Thermoanaerobaculaceae bacterium]MDI9621346.1 polyphosphate kinase 2 family protein [Acidobacteriota bacterium]NLH12452.1 polyphosphate kinase 2 family protein [Holophagae bacterium]HPW54122.1 polyphosphate kinase 2 family protein [Thermoanaerobaculaceae bacterium]
MNVERFCIKPGSRLDWKDHDPDATPGCKSKAAAAKPLLANLERLLELQEQLFAQSERALLIVLQGMDTSGKDGVIEHVMGAFNPQGVKITSFKVPTPEELTHDFLWRVHKATPGRGMVGIFNRSHYEDVLVVRVAGLAPKAVWSTRYAHINAFEKLLADSGVAIVKIFLHISPEEQAERLTARRDTPEKQWKFSPGDLKVRTQWSAYMKAYQDALERCSTGWAPWYVVPSNKKWYRNLAISEILVDTMSRLGLAYPPPVEGIASYEIPPAG